MESNHSAMPAGPVTPESDNAPCQARVIEEQGATDRSIFDEADAHRKRTLTARAALLGLVLRPMAGGAWCVVTESGAETAMPSLQAAEALVWGCEQVQAEIGALAARLVPSRELRA